MKNTTAKPVSSKVNRAPVRPGAFAFCERVSGAVRFRVDAAPGGALPVQQAASLLAIHCLVRGQRPCDYTVLIVPRGSMLASVSRRAQRLLQAGQAIGSELPLSRRKREVLECVLRNLSNKEIAARLNLSEHTVKFHVSALLGKFKVQDRIGLMREAAVGLIPAAVPSDNLFGFPMPPDRKIRPVEPKL
jgi:DNA-binding CsgD family transcriptional regulator